MIVSREQTNEVCSEFEQRVNRSHSRHTMSTWNSKQEPTQCPITVAIGQTVLILLLL